MSPRRARERVWVKELWAVSSKSLPQATAMIRANDTPVRRNENIGTPTLAPLKTGSRARSSRLRGRSCAERPIGSTASAAAYSSVNPGRVPASEPWSMSRTFVGPSVCSRGNKTAQLIVSGDD